MSVPRILLSLTIVLFFMGEGMAQLSQKPFIQRSNALIGLSYSRMLGDDIYDQDLMRMQFGYLYDAYGTDKVNLRLGAMYRVKGGKSFTENNYQTFSYLTFPISLSLPFSGGSSFGLSAQPGLLLFNETRVRGSKSLLSPNPYPRSPAPMDVSLSPFMELKLTETVGLNLAGSYSFGSTSDENTKLNFGGLSLSLVLNFGQAVQGVEELVEKGRGKNYKLLDLEQGTVIVVLHNKVALAKYFEEQGDEELADEILKDAEIRNEALIEAFERHYKFSDVLFAYNNQVTPICNGDSSQLLFTATGKKVPVSDINHLEYVFFHPGDIYLKLKDFSGQGYYFEDSKGNRLSDPFPTQVGLRKKPKDFNEMIRGLNRRLVSRADVLRDRKGS